MIGLHHRAVYPTPSGPSELESRIDRDEDVGHADVCGLYRKGVAVRVDHGVAKMVFDCFEHFSPTWVPKELRHLGD